MPQTPMPNKLFELGLEIWRRALLGAEQAGEELRKRAEGLGGAKPQEKDRPPRIW